MTPKGKERLLKLADILDAADALHRQKKEPTYDQTTVLHECGTPACAIGHWAANNRQRFQVIDGSIIHKDLQDYEQYSLLAMGRVEFGLTHEQSEELFETSGCGEAQTAKRAARYIRKFVARVEREQNDAVEAYRKRIESGEVLEEAA